MSIEKTPKLNGYAVRSWGDLVAVATVLAMLLSCVAWGLKLEARNDTLQLVHTADIKDLNAEVNALKLIVSRGILPRAEERIDRIDEKDKDIERRLDKLEDRQ